MKQGKTLTELASELERRASAQRDMVAPAKSLRLTANEAMPTGIELVVGDEPFGVTDHCHKQIGLFTGIPAKYYNRMREDAPWLLAGNVNHWMADSDKRRMVRTLDGNARAFLSDRYRRFDNLQLAEGILPTLLENDDEALRIESCDVTDTRLFIKVVFPRIEAEVKKGDVVNAGIEISNSEIGMGSVSVLPFVYRLVCLNGMTLPDRGMKRYHVGRQVEGEGESVFEMFRDETIAADDKALVMKLQDVVRGAMRGENGFEGYVQAMRDASEGLQAAAPVKAVEELGKTVELTQTEQTSVLTHLLQAGDFSRYGMLNAVTRSAQDAESYDRASELERTGGRILTLPAKDWTRIAEAA